jgi:rSAM/selenodomain-associated transferase 2
VSLTARRTPAADAPFAAPNPASAAVRGPVGARCGAENDPRASACISIIIPARNEAAIIADTIRHALNGEPAEVIVVDGGSADHTVGVARAAGARVMTAAPGRAVQLNAGAHAARGDTLLFLHADTRLPGDFATHVNAVLSAPDVVAGAFGFRLDAEGRVFRILESLVNWRSRRLGMPYGDQALFMSADTFRRVGGFAELPVMEDLELVRRLRRAGRLEIAQADALTSARRWVSEGVWRTTLRNQLYIAAYGLGVAPARIALWRRRAAR